MKLFYIETPERTWMDVMILFFGAGEWTRNVERMFCDPLSKHDETFAQFYPLDRVPDCTYKGQRNTQTNGHTSMPPAELEPTIPGFEISRTMRVRPHSRQGWQNIQISTYQMHIKVGKFSVQ
jgi:hypothetical protein